MESIRPTHTIRTFGQPGGLWFAYTLDLDRGEYVVVNEGGDEVFTSGSEQDCIDFCEDESAATLDPLPPGALAHMKAQPDLKLANVFPAATAPNDDLTFWVLNEPWRLRAKVVRRGCDPMDNGILAVRVILECDFDMWQGIALLEIHGRTLDLREHDGDLDFSKLPEKFVARILRHIVLG